MNEKFTCTSQLKISIKVKDISTYRVKSELRSKKNMIKNQIYKTKNMYSA